jgi:ureidoacrylate peracid hydrolase
MSRFYYFTIATPDSLFRATIIIVLRRKEHEMPHKIPGLSRRRLLAAIAMSSVGAIAEGLPNSKLAGTVHVGSGRKSRPITVNAQVSRDGQQGGNVPISIDAARTAIIVCDMQNDFGARGGMFDRAGIDITSIQKAVGPTAKVLASARRADVTIVYLKMGFRPDLSDLGALDSVNRVRHLEAFKVGQTMRAPDGQTSRILIRDNWGTDIISELKPQADDIVLYKHRFSGFYETELDAALKRLGIKHLIFTGCTTSVCIESTIRDAMFRDYLPVLLADCTGEPIGSHFPRSNHDASLLAIETLFGWVSGSEEFLKALEAAQR